MNDEEKKLTRLIEKAKLGEFNGYMFHVCSELSDKKSLHICWQDNEIVYDVEKKVVLEIKSFCPKQDYILTVGEAMPCLIQKDIDDFLRKTSAKDEQLTNRDLLDLAWESLNDEITYVDEHGNFHHEKKQRN